MEGLFPGLPTGLKQPFSGNWVPGQKMIGCMLFRSTNQTIATAGPYVTVTWDRVTYDTDNMTDIINANDRITIRTPGWYFVHGNTEWATGSSTGERDQKFLVNAQSGSKIGSGPLPGGSYQQTRKSLYAVDWARQSFPVNNTAVNTIHFSFFLLWFDSGDFIQLQVAQNSGGDLAIVSDNSRPNFGCWRIG